MDTKILELLMDSKEHFDGSDPKLHPEYLRKVVDNIADIVYDTSPATNDIQLNVLALVQQWCSSSKYHLRIDSSNYDCLINSLNKSFAGKDDESELDLGDVDINVTSHIARHYERMEKIGAERDSHLKLILEFDRRKLEEAFQPQQNGTSEENEYADALRQLNSTKSLSPCLEPKSKSGNNTTDGYETRKKQVDAGYSLLNLEKTDGNLLLLSNILNLIKSYENLLPFEVNLVNYVWDKLGDTDTGVQLLESFPFVYEKPLLKMCTDFLKSESTSNISESVKYVKALSKRSETVGRNIIAALFDLYALSNYDGNLLTFLNSNDLLR